MILLLLIIALALSIDGSNAKPFSIASAKTTGSIPTRFELTRPFKIHRRLQEIITDDGIVESGSANDSVSTADPASNVTTIHETFVTNETASLVTVVSYEFYVKSHFEKPQESIAKDVESAVRDVIDGILRDEGSILHQYAVNDGLVIVSISTDFSLPALGFLCVPTFTDVCTALSVSVEVSHLNTASSEEISSALGSINVPKLIDVKDYTVVYDEYEPVVTKTEISLAGIPARAMVGNEAAIFEGACQEFLNQYFSMTNLSDAGLKILSVVVGDQEVISNSSLTIEKSALRRLIYVNKIDALIKGEYRPPPLIDFGSIVEDSINAQPQQFSDVLSSRSLCERGTSVLGTNRSACDYFEGAEVIGAREIIENEEEPADSYIGIISNEAEDTDPEVAPWAIAVVVLAAVCVGILGAVVFRRLRPNSSKQNVKENAGNSTDEDGMEESNNSSHSGREQLASSGQVINRNASVESVVEPNHLEEDADDDQRQRQTTSVRDPILFETLRSTANLHAIPATLTRDSTVDIQQLDERINAKMRESDQIAPSENEKKVQPESVTRVKDFKERLKAKVDLTYEGKAYPGSDRKNNNGASNSDPESESDSQDNVEGVPENKTPRFTALLNNKIDQMVTGEDSSEMENVKGISDVDGLDAKIAEKLKDKGFPDLSIVNADINSDQKGKTQPSISENFEQIIKAKIETNHASAMSEARSGSNVDQLDAKISAKLKEKGMPEATNTKEEKPDQEVRKVQNIPVADDLEQRMKAKIDAE